MIDYGYGVRLDTINDYDLNEMRAWRNDKRIWKWCRQPDLIPWRDHKAWFDGNTEKMYAIRLCRATEIIGICGLTSIDTIARRAEFSLYIGPEHWRKGYARKALKTLFRHGFDNLNLNLIWGETFDGNPAYDLFISLGMKPEGLRREFYFKDGKYIDAHLLSIKRDECDF